MFADGFPDRLVFIAGDRIFCPAQGINDREGRLQVMAVIMIPGNEKQCQLVGAGEGTVPAFWQSFGICRKVPGFQSGLGVFAVVVMAFTVIGKNAAFRILNEHAVDGIVLCAPFEPVLQVFGRDRKLQGQESCRFIGCDFPGIHLVLESGEPVEVIAVLAVVVGFHATAGSIGSPHDGAESVNGNLRILGMEGTNPVFPGHEGGKRFVVLPGIHEATINEGIRRKNCRIGADHILFDPPPDEVWTATEIFPGKVGPWRREHRITGSFCRIHRIVKAHGPVVLGNKKNGAGKGGGAKGRKAGRHGQNADFFVKTQWYPSHYDSETVFYGLSLYFNNLYYIIPGNWAKGSRETSFPWLLAVSGREGWTTFSPISGYGQALGHICRVCPLVIHRELLIQ